MPTYHLYIANKNYSSWSFRPWLLMRQLGVPFVEHFHPLNGNSYRQPQWAAFSPTAHVPCLHALPDPNDNEEKQEEPIIVWESLAIAEFLADSHPSLSVWPSDPRARAWARSACAEMATSFHAIRNQMGMNVGIRVRLDPSLFSVADGDGNEQLTDLGKDLKRLDALWTEGLTKFGGPFLAGKEFGAVDAWFAPVVLRLETYLGAKERLGEVARGYVKRMVELEGVKEWVKDALVEKERMELYERDCAVGVGRALVEDLRVKV